MYRISLLCVNIYTIYNLLSFPIVREEYTSVIIIGTAYKLVSCDHNIKQLGITEEGLGRLNDEKAI